MGDDDGDDDDDSDDDGVVVVEIVRLGRSIRCEACKYEDDDVVDGESQAYGMK